MKKSLIIAVLAGAALAGCTIDERDGGMKNDSRNLITFTTPVTGAVTRGETTPDYGPVTGTTYPESEWFHVFAVKSTAFDANYAGTEDWGTKYMDVDVSMKEDAGRKYWAPAEDYYWPKNGKLTFAAYSPAKMSPSPTYDGAGLKIEDFQTPAVGQQYDVMYAPRVFNKTEVDRPLDTGTPNPYYGVDITFHHTLSKIVFFVKSDNTNITLTEIDITGVINKGTFNETIVNGATYSATPAWTPDATSTTDYTPFSGTQLATGSFVQVGDGTTTPAYLNNTLLMIPQTIPDAANITIKWTYQNGGSGGTTLSDEKTIQLKTIVDEWEMNKCYKYNITIAMDKIYFNPAVTDWDTCSDNAVDIS